MPPSYRAPASPNALAVVVQAKFQEAAALHQAGRLDEARPLYEQVVKKFPGHADAHHLLGYLVYQQGDPKRALELIGKAVKLNPRNAAFHFNRGLILQAVGRPEPALASFDRALALRPEDAEAHAGRGAALLALGRPAEALAAYDRVLQLRAGDAETHTNRGVALKQLGRLAEAVAAYDQAIALDPGNAEAFSNRGNARREQGRPDAALADYDRAIALNPGYAEARSNRGAALKDLGRLQEAVAGFDQALALRPGDIDAQLNKAGALLLGGDFTKGLALYEWRWRREGLRQFREPLWLGEQPLLGRSILLHGEQGLGDTLQFCRYVPLVAALGARVILEVQAPLVGLLSRLGGIDQLIARGDRVPPVEFHTPLGSLPLAFQATPGTLPATEGYLAADPAKARAWADRLGPKTRFRVGLAWSGSLDHPNDRHRSLPLADLLRALPDGPDYVSLHKEVREGDRAALQADARLRHFGEDLHDFGDTAALAETMDLVISVDTSAAHLGGALGKPTWVLLPRVGLDWRWQLGRDDSPWYGSMTLYRQGTDGGWGETFARLRRDLVKAA